MVINNVFSHTSFQLICYKSSHPKSSIKKIVLKNFTKFTGKHQCKSLFFNKVAGLRLATLFKKRLRHRCFPVNFRKFLRTLFVQNTSGGCFYCSHFIHETRKITITIQEKTNSSSSLVHLQDTLGKKQLTNQKP